MQRVFVFVDRARVVLFVFYVAERQDVLSGGRSVSPSLVPLTHGDIESVSVRRRKNCEIAASNTPI